MAGVHAAGHSKQLITTTMQQIDSNFRAAIIITIKDITWQWPAWDQISQLLKLVEYSRQPIICCNNKLPLAVKMSSFSTSSTAAASCDLYHSIATAASKLVAVFSLKLNNMQLALNCSCDPATLASANCNFGGQVGMIMTSLLSSLLLLLLLVMLLVMS